MECSTLSTLTTLPRKRALEYDRTPVTPNHNGCRPTCTRVMSHVVPGFPSVLAAVLCFIFRSATLARTTRDGGFKFFEISELEQLMLDAGFADVEVRGWARGHGCSGFVSALVS